MKNMSTTKAVRDERSFLINLLRFQKLVVARRANAFLMVNFYANREKLYHQLLCVNMLRQRGRNFLYCEYKLSHQ